MLAVSALSGALGAWLIVSASVSDVDAVTEALTAIDARLTRLEARQRVAAHRDAPAEAAPAERATVAVAGTGQTSAQSRAGESAALMFELFDSDLDPDTRREQAYALLQSSMVPERYMALRVLADLDDPSLAHAVADFVGGAGTDRRKLRMAAGAVDLLGDVEGAAVNGQLYGYLNHPDEEVRMAAARQLEMRGDRNAMARIVDEFSLAFQSEDAGARSQAARALGRTRSASAVTPLVDALADPSLEVRIRAVQGLGMTGSEEAIPALTMALEAPSAEVRALASRSLEQIRGPQRDPLSSWRAHEQ